jgi:hypothetical protein
MSTVIDHIVATSAYGSPTFNFSSYVQIIHKYSLGNAIHNFSIET